MKKTKVLYTDVKNYKGSGRFPYSKYEFGRARAVHLFCFECQGCDMRLVKSCPDVDCPLYRYRPK